MIARFLEVALNGLGSGVSRHYREEDREWRAEDVAFRAQVQEHKEEQHAFK